MPLINMSFTNPYACVLSILSLLQLILKIAEIIQQLSERLHEKYNKNMQFQILAVENG